MKTATQVQAIPTVNGLIVDNITKLAGRIAASDNYGQFQFRAHNRWLGGAVTSSTIQGFYAAEMENVERTAPLTVDSDQPDFLGGSNTAPNPVEHLLHALASCLTTTLVYHASVQGIDVQDVSVSCRGNMDAKGFFGISGEVPKGYRTISVEMVVKSAASVDTLTSLAMHSPVYDLLSRAALVNFALTKQP